MFIPRHAVNLDPSHDRERYEYELDSARRKLEILRDPMRSDLLAPLGTSAGHVYDYGLRIAADPTVCAWALTVAARANTAVFVFRRLQNPSLAVRLDDGPTFTFITTVDESSVHSGRWVDAVQQAIVARRQDCLAELLPITYEELSRSSTSSANPTRDYHYAELHRVLARCAVDPTRRLAPDYLTHATGARPAKVRPVNQRIGEANNRMAEAIDAGDAVRFNGALAESLKLRRTAFADLPDDTQRNHTALWPLGVIALAALAQDRGLTVEVESDYLPRLWVTGDLFR